MSIPSEQTIQSPRQFLRSKIRRPQLCHIGSRYHLPLARENTLDLLASSADQSLAVHEAMPEDFGPVGERWPLFAACLRTMLSRHPKLLIDVIGLEEALLKLGLEAGTVRGFRATIHTDRTPRMSSLLTSLCPTPYRGAMASYEERAKEMRELARTVRTSEAREELTQLAEQYEKLARRQKAARTKTDAPD